MRVLLTAKAAVSANKILNKRWPERNASAIFAMHMEQKTDIDCSEVNAGEAVQKNPNEYPIRRCRSCDNVGDSVPLGRSGRLYGGFCSRRRFGSSIAGIHNRLFESIVRGSCLDCIWKISGRAYVFPISGFLVWFYCSWPHRYSKCFCCKGVPLYVFCCLLLPFVWKDWAFAGADSLWTDCDAVGAGTVCFRQSIRQFGVSDAVPSERTKRSTPFFGREVLAALRRMYDCAADMHCISALGDPRFDWNVC